MDWINLTEIILTVLTCLACYVTGKIKGVGSTISLLLEKEIITEKDLEKLHE